MSILVEKQAARSASHRLASEHRGPALAPPEISICDNRAELSIAGVGQVAPISVLLVCGHPIEREGVRLIIEGQPGMTVVGDIGGSLEELGALDKDADVILFDIDSDDQNGLKHLPRVINMAGRGRVLVLADAYREDMCRQIAHFGAMGLVSKNQAVEILVKAINKVYSGEVWFSRATMAGLIRHIAQPAGRRCDDEVGSRISTLTKREREVVQLLGQGLNVEMLARRLFISETTVRHHLSSILEKLCVRDRFELVFYAYRHGLAVPPTYP